jgi:protein dithiol oxidoreductase (disulfide-forming)
MKKILCALMLLLTTMANANSNFVAGEHYQLLPTKQSAEPEVVEYFSYFCPFCYNFEPVVANLKTALPDGITLTKVPVPFIGGAMGPVLQRAHALAVLLQVEEQVGAALFNQIHQVRKAPENRSAVKLLFVAAGIDKQQFDANVDSMPVNMLLSDYDNAIKETGISSVPSFVVNNKYLVNLKAISSQEQFDALVNYLLTLPAAKHAK